MDVSGYSYNPITGKFFNRFGKEVGSYTRKYGRIMIQDKHVSLSRLAVRLMTGEWPKYEVDHVNRVPHNNQWINLRDCHRNSNVKNKGLYKSNKSGFKGVFETPTGFICKIQVDGDNKYLGTFKSKEEAARAYDKSAIYYNEEFASLNFN